MCEKNEIKKKNTLNDGNFNLTKDIFKKLEKKNCQKIRRGPRNEHACVYLQQSQISVHLFIHLLLKPESRP